ncbi:hypothetical protein AVEN_96839-1 [Araneus ventricosus]|uniref:RNase H type-1 domain-containing protein n=1 Tax=Araneus ventricosus TaxID=182803 RepID=A0A4Y2WC10_ARAVE|nr:hypothetical protein AVEN_96839-1 [Araneus ventricosus]
MAFRVPNGSLPTPKENKPICRPRNFDFCRATNRNWTTMHSGVSWNEKADSIAKQVSDFSPYIDWIASEDIFPHLKKQSLQITEENYHKSKYQSLIGNIPDILTISKWTGNRVQDRLIARG